MSENLYAGGKGVEEKPCRWLLNAIGVDGQDHEKILLGLESAGIC
tara:strand:- start:814 stop:948 length:135 start_codon:yes stop_codon:yes gene_type:complete